MNNDKPRHLIAKYLAGECTPSEKQEVERWYDEYDAGNKKYLNDDAEEIKSSAERSFEELRERLALPVEVPGGQIKSFKVSVKVWLAAASILLVLSVGGYFLLGYSAKSQLTAQQETGPIKPGTNKAILTLPGGEKINLTDAGSGVLAKAGGISISKTADGQLVYQSSREDANISNGKVQYNTLSTPRGGQFQVILPDGSHVWLNSASTIVYPTAFTGKTRAVKLQGEAYFEVAKNKHMPFVVTTNKLDVKVLGTHFNVTAYDDDAAITTTLLEGSVQLNKGTVKAMLTPGLQGVAFNNQQNIAVQKANMEQVMAWRNGYFAFEDTSIKDVMKIAARWYDVEVSYHGSVENKKFGGSISRYKNITELLDNMSESGGFHYQIEGRRILLTD
ncbi:FecR domain-containing protein [Mucilaginibacter sp. Mucisp86]|uniref:FecR domain-containing protein n=1 Tax=Mucilaginibacter sp. Mucisp86 TaxID=3243060 RepID=UPI0039B403B7